MMIKEACIRNCKYKVQSSDGSPSHPDQCELYGTTLSRMLIPDPYDKGVISVYCKCNDCLEKEMSCSIDTKIREIYSFYSSFTQEMDILFKELTQMSRRREDIYK